MEIYSLKSPKSISSFIKIWSASHSSTTPFNETVRRHLETFLFNRPFYLDIARRPCCAPALTLP